MNDKGVPAQKIQVDLGDLALLLGLDPSRVRLISVGSDPIINVAFLYTVSVENGDEYISEWMSGATIMLNGESELE